MITEKVCPKCSHTKLLSEFSPNKKYRLGVGSWCKKCRSAASMEYVFKNREAVSSRNSRRHSRGKNDAEYMARRRSSRRRYKVKKKYGMTQDQINEMLKAIPSCPSCGRNWGTGMSGPAIDHNHVTKKFRGIICRKCNAGIGLLGDNIDGLMRAVSYLSSAENT